MDTADETPGGQGDSTDPPRRSDLSLVRQALRNDWPVQPEVREQIVGRILEYLTQPGGADRTVLMAAQTLAKFCDLTLKQQLLDLRTRQLEGKPEAVSLSDLVSAAEARAEKRIQ